MISDTLNRSGIKYFLTHKNPFRISDLLISRSGKNNMENDTKEKTKINWWQTVPGILTAVAALMTAAGGLMLALNQVGCFDKTNLKNEKVADQKEKTTENKSQNIDQNESQKLTDNTNTEYKGAISKIEDVNFEGSVYKFLDTRLEYYSPDKSLLKLKLNVENNFNGVYVNADLFRLLIGRNKSAPETCTAQWVEQHSSIDADVAFIIPNDATAVQLQIGDVNAGEKGAIKIPINIKSK